MVGRWCGEGGAELDLSAEGGFTASAVTGYYSLLGAAPGENRLGTETRDGRGEWRLSNASPKSSQVALKFAKGEVAYFFAGVEEEAAVLWSDLEKDGDFVVLTRC
ncbi:hypothetical protein ACL02R_03860 [Streptomyces sp. MS19]|uniref:hypothetical protein n=1 Tax=Streptomyces sp. MS19 TaxID=3385972 RepID=UPI0039A2C0E5